MLPLTRRNDIALILVLLLAGLGLVAGWRLFWHLTDDAYIAFRYISNSHFGFGYVWNPPPFRPVEGYTSFLWVVLLDLLWRVTSVAPPASANWVSLAFAAGTLLVTAAMVLRLRLTPALARHRLALLALVLVGLLTNRTFLAWTSSGLETAMHNFWLAGWVLVALSFGPGGRRWLTGLAALATLMALTRPDGLLFVAATGALIAAWLWQRWRAGQARAADLLPLAPFLVIAAHLLWRYATYGEWLPNTYAAKYVAPWPESGARYLLAFVMEYSLWVWLGVLALAGLVRLRRPGAMPARLRGWLAAPLQPALVQFVVVGALAAHWAYYTFIIGGDHFEYRVYSHLLPLLSVSLIWAMNRLAMRPPAALGVMVLSVALALPIPWTLWAASLQYTTRRETLNLSVPIARFFPALLQPYVGVFDDAQRWLIERAVGVRHQEHKAFWLSQQEGLPTREAGLLLRPEAQAVRVEGAVGVIGWVLPTVAIVDGHGLTDYVVARHPLDALAPRLMAHDRYAPAGYLACFYPNTDAALSRFIIAQRPERLEKIVPDCEHRDWPVTPWEPEFPNANFGLPEAAGRVLYNVWSVDPLFVYYVPPDQRPVQSAAALRTVFELEYHDAGCLVYPAPGAAGAYHFAFLPPNVRYSPEDLRALFPWAGLVDFQRTGGPRPYSAAYALPAQGEVPAPNTPHAVDWAPARLLGFHLTDSSLSPGGEVETLLYFRLRGSVPTEQWFRLSLAPAAAPEAPIATDQGDPCRGLYPAWLWQPDETLVVKSLLYVPPDLPPGDYALRVDMFDLAVGPDQLLPATGEQTLAMLTLP